MESANSKPDQNTGPRLLNLGCGRQFHSDWINLDLEAVSTEVQEHDITKGVPFPSDSMDAVYHSHVLEHLKPADGQKLLEDCYRVLRPGGVLRIVVPDLERIARLYLANHQKAMNGEVGADINYNWMKLELLDQMVRETSGGRMGRYMAAEEIKNSNFVKSRVGDEFWICRSTPEQAKTRQSLLEKFSKTVRRYRTRFARLLVRALMGKNGLAAFEEGVFRSSGEIHRWMYDRYSLKVLCREVGFRDFRVCQADESDIEEFASFELDTNGDCVRKPDSLFVECVKPHLSEAAVVKRAA